MLFTFGSSTSYIKIYIKSSGTLHVYAGNTDNFVSPSGFAVGGPQFLAVVINGGSVVTYSNSSTTTKTFNPAWLAPTSNVQLTLAYNDNTGNTLTTSGYGNFAGAISDVQIMAVRLLGQPD